MLQRPYHLYHSESAANAPAPHKVLSFPPCHPPHSPYPLARRRLPRRRFSLSRPKPSLLPFFPPLTTHIPLTPSPNPISRCIIRRPLPVGAASISSSSRGFLFFRCLTLVCSVICNFPKPALLPCRGRLSPPPPPSGSCSFFLVPLAQCILDQTNTCTRTTPLPTCLSLCYHTSIIIITINITIIISLTFLFPLPSASRVACYSVSRPTACPSSLWLTSIRTLPFETDGLG